MITMVFRTGTRGCAAVLIGLLLNSQAQAASMNRLDTVPIPPGTQLSRVSEKTEHNGAAVSIATYQSTLTLDDTLAFYKSTWPDKGNSKSLVDWNLWLGIGCL